MRTVIIETRSDTKDVNRHDRIENCSELSEGKPCGTRRSREIINNDTDVGLECVNGCIWLRIGQGSKGGPSEISVMLVAKSETHQKIPPWNTNWVRFVTYSLGEH